MSDNDSDSDPTALTPEIPPELAQLISSGKIPDGDSFPSLKMPGTEPEEDQSEKSAADSDQTKWKKVQTIGGPDSGADLQFPFSAALGDDGTLFVMDCPDRNSYRVTRFDAAGNFRGEVIRCQKGDGLTDLQYPKGIAVGANMICIPDAGNDRIQIFSENGEHMRIVGKAGEEPGQLSFPCDVDIDDLGVLYVGDTGNSRIQKLTSQGDHLASFGVGEDGLPNWDDPCLDEPTGVTFDRDGNVFVADTNHNRVVKFDPAGERLLTFGKEGDEPGDFDEPSDIRVENDGTILVADQDNARVQLFDSEGIFIESFQLASGGGGDAGGDVAIDENGFLYLCDPDEHCIEKIEIFRTKSL